MCGHRQPLVTHPHLSLDTGSSYLVLCCAQLQHTTQPGLAVPRVHSSAASGPRLHVSTVYLAPALPPLATLASQEENFRKICFEKKSKRVLMNPIKTTRN